MTNSDKLMLIPQFVIAGAPKCGTTALCEYLSEHPSICLSTPKEPMYFLSEWPELQVVNSEPEYLRCFSRCYSKNNIVTGEGSALYLLSQKAIPEIMKFNPATKILIMIRNPVDMAISLYAQNLFYGDEDQITFESAWNMQNSRAMGINIPKGCRHPVLLQYELNCKLGVLVNRAFSFIPELQRKVIVFDDFIKDTGSVYRDVLKFLGLPDDGRQYFPRVNAKKKARLPWINNLLARPPRSLQSISLHLKGMLGIRSLGIHKAVVGLNTAKSDLEVVSPDMRMRMVEIFSGEIDLLSRLLLRNLDEWKK